MSSQFNILPPLPPSNMIDVVPFIIPQPRRYVRDVFVELLADYRLAVHLYRPTGVYYPEDRKAVTGDGVYARVTDWPGHWQDPTAYRIYTNPNPGSSQLGVKLLNRYYDPNSGRVPVADYTTNLITTECWANGQKLSASSAKGQTFMELRRGVDFGGQLGVLDTMVSIYLYDWSTKLSKQLNKPQEQEEFYWALGSSWAWWIHYQLQADGSYLKDNEQKFNTFIPDTLASPGIKALIQL